MHLAPLLERSRGRLVATLPDGRVGDGEVSFDIDAAGERRVYAIGFVVTSSGPAHIGAELVRADGTRGEPIDVKLDAGSTYAGVVELDASPDLVSGITLRLPPAEGEATLHDLFVISYG